MKVNPLLKKVLLNLLTDHMKMLQSRSTSYSILSAYTNQESDRLFIEQMKVLDDDVFLGIVETYIGKYQFDKAIKNNAIDVILE